MLLAEHLRTLAPLQEQLHHHPLYARVRTMEDIRSFMAHHVFSVWDFMSLLKSLQQHVAPSAQPWAPRGPTSARRFINAIVLEEESDVGLPDGTGNPTFASHFELYAQAMTEVGADPSPARQFARLASECGFGEALRQAGDTVPVAARMFMQETFSVIASGEPHRVAASFALGREQIIPPMFRALLRDMHITPAQAPAFHYYLERHIHLDEGEHAPMAIRLLDELCRHDPVRMQAEAVETARRALQARIEFWDGVLAATPSCP
jgi:hypothetical protein